MSERHGNLKVITGCMYSGKSATLLRDRNRLKAAGIKYIGAKPKADKRNGFNIHTRDGGNPEYAQELSDPRRLDSLAFPGQHVLIDEVQFLDMSYFPVISGALFRGTSFIVAGLDTNFRGEPFAALTPMGEGTSIMSMLLALADEVEKLTAICTVCKGVATRTQRLIENRDDGKLRLDPAPYDGPLVDKPGDFVYEARCRTHHLVPGRPGT